jgi:hypothetical protein
MLPGVNDFVSSTEPHFVQTTEAAIERGSSSLPSYPPRSSPQPAQRVLRCASPRKEVSPWSALMTTMLGTQATTRCESRLLFASPAESSGRPVTAATVFMPWVPSATFRRSGAATATAVRRAAPRRIPA